jgi:hypothetical protein
MTARPNAVAAVTTIPVVSVRSGAVVPAVVVQVATTLPVPYLAPQFYYGFSAVGGEELAQSVGTGDTNTETGTGTAPDSEVGDSRAADSTIQGRTIGV